MFWNNVQHEIQLRNLILWLYWSPLNFRKETFSSLEFKTRVGSTEHITGEIRSLWTWPRKKQGMNILGLVCCGWVSRFWLGWGLKGWLLRGASVPCRGTRTGAFQSKGEELWHAGVFPELRKLQLTSKTPQELAAVVRTADKMCAGLGVMVVTPLPWRTTLGASGEMPG